MILTSAVIGIFLIRLPDQIKSGTVTHYSYRAQLLIVPVSHSYSIVPIAQSYSLFLSRTVTQLFLSRSVTHCSYRAQLLIVPIALSPSIFPISHSYSIVPIPGRITYNGVAIWLRTTGDNSSFHPEKHLLYIQQKENRLSPSSER